MDNLICSIISEYITHKTYYNTCLVNKNFYNMAKRHNKINKNDITLISNEEIDIAKTIANQLQNKFIFSENDKIRIFESDTDVHDYIINKVKDKLFEHIFIDMDVRGKLSIMFQTNCETCNNFKIAHHNFGALKKLRYLFHIKNIYINNIKYKKKLE